MVLWVKACLHSGHSRVHRGIVTFALASIAGGAHRANYLESYTFNSCESLKSFLHSGVNNMRAAIYARVSTNIGQDPHMQMRELREYCQRRGWEVAGEYVDAGVSGTKQNRPRLDALWAECRKRRVDAVVVYRYDRFARSLRQLVNALEEFRSLGIEFISLHEGVDTSTPNGRLVFGIFASIAEFERELIRDRVKSGIAAAKSRGKRLGRPRVSVDAARIAALRASGLSWPKIAVELGVSVGTVYGAAHRLSKIHPKRVPTSD